jgi:chromosome partitioning protein
MTHIISVCLQKGGVGKTTLTINLGAALAARGVRVLVIDLDPQGHLTEGVGLAQSYLTDHYNLYTALTNATEQQGQQLIESAPHDQFEVIPSHYELMLAEQALYMARGREHRLKKLLDTLPNTYDVILLDCPPALGNLTDNALNAARNVLIPVQAEATSIRALELLFDQIESIEKGLSIKVQVVGVVPNLVQDSKLSHRILDELRENVPHIAPFVIRKRVVLQEAWNQGRSIFTYEPHTNAEKQTKDDLMQTYTQLAEWLTTRMQEAAYVR